MRGIGDNIRKFRLESGMSQQQLADRIGKTRSAVSQYESGTIIPRMPVVESIAHALRVKNSDIIGEKYVYGFVEMPTEEQELVDIYRHLGEKERSVLMSTARALKEG